MTTIASGPLERRWGYWAELSPGRSHSAFTGAEIPGPIIWEFPSGKVDSFHAHCAVFSPEGRTLAGSVLRLVSALDGMPGKSRTCVAFSSTAKSRYGLAPSQTRFRWRFLPTATGSPQAGMATVRLWSTNNLEVLSPCRPFQPYLDSCVLPRRQHPLPRQVQTRPFGCGERIERRLKRLKGAWMSAASGISRFQFAFSGD